MPPLGPGGLQAVHEGGGEGGDREQPEVVLELLEDQPVLVLGGGGQAAELWGVQLIGAHRAGEGADRERRVRRGVLDQRLDVSPQLGFVERVGQTH